MSMSSQCSSGYYSDSSCDNPVSLKTSKPSYPKNTRRLLLSKEKKSAPATVVVTSHSFMQGELTMSAGIYKNTPVQSGLQRTSRIPKPTTMSDLFISRVAIYT